jgi:hypothetical protein
MKIKQCYLPLVTYGLSEPELLQDDSVPNIAVKWVTRFVFVTARIQT